MNTPDFLTSLGDLSLTLRMRRLADRLSEHGRAVYRDLEVGLEPGWYAPLLLLQAHEPLSVSQAARWLGVQHPTMVKVSRALEQAGLVTSISDPRDGRRRLMQLTPMAHQQFPRYQRVWSAFEEALSDLSVATHASLGETLCHLESLLDTQGLDARVRAILERDDAPVRAKERITPEVRGVEARDRDAVLAMARELVRSGDTYAYARDVSDEELWAYWAPETSGDGFVAVWKGEVVGMFVVRPNHPGPGSHVANASFAVRADQRGLGLGRFMGEAALDEARRLGYEAMQFNIVVSTNEHAVRLWRSLGFQIVGTIPDGFRLPNGRRVPHHIMYQSLTHPQEGGP